MRPSRREFVKWVTASGIALSLSRLESAEAAGFSARAPTCRGAGTSIRPPLAPAGSMASPRSPAQSFTPPIFAPPICRAGRQRPRTPSWSARPMPRMSTSAWTSRASAAPSKPSVVVTAADLVKIGTRVPEFYTGDLFCPIGKTPLYLGQPVGAADLRDSSMPSMHARLALRDGTFVKFGEETGPVAVAGLRRVPLYARRWPDAGRARCLFAGPGRLGVSQGRSRTRRCRSGRPSPRTPWRPMPRPRFMASRSAPSSHPKNPALLVLDRELRDAVGRPDVSRTGMRARLVQREERKTRTGARRAVALRGGGVRSRICSARRARRSSRRASTPSSPMSAAAFGGRDHTPFVLYVALAAMFFPGKPVRLAHDRYQQFQGGIKRHAIKMHSRIGVDRATGKIQAFAADHVLDGGGLANFSPTVATVAADRLDRHLRRSEGRRHHRGASYPRRDRGIDARLRNAAVHDRARSIDR